jgi:hypothetical protein
MGDLRRLSRLLDRLHRLGRIRSRLQIFLTEYGYETNPPDTVRGVNLRRQARYHGHATFLAWRRRDVASFAQFQLVDIAPRDDPKTPEKDSHDWQTGLYFHDGRPKPMVRAFKLPFWAEAHSAPGADFVVLFGQVRPGSGRHQVEIEVLAPNGSWLPVQTYETRANGDSDCATETTTFLTDAQGFYQRVAPYQGPATYRARWIKAGGGVEYSITIPVRSPPPTPTS